VSQARDEFKRAVLRELREVEFSEKEACSFAAVTEDDILFKIRTRNSASKYTTEIRAFIKAIEETL
jgi:hypothetical protein